jgi:N-acetylneuraminic acid mutarotase
VRVVALCFALAACSTQSDPQTLDRGWSNIAASPIAGRTAHAAVWTGGEMIVFGGEGKEGSLADGAAYDPASDRWQRLPEGPLGPRRHPLMVWTGLEVVIHGGLDAEALNDGASYDPATHRWTSLPPAPLSARTLPAFAYAPSTHELVVFGQGEGMAFNTEARTWRMIAKSPLPARSFVRGVWTGEQILFFGGLDDAGVLATEAAEYDPARDSWRVIDTDVAPRASVSAVATDRGAAFFGGQGVSKPDGCPAALNDGATFDTATHALRRIPTATTTPRAEPALWFGQGKLFVFGGYQCDAILGDGAAFDGDTWSTLPKSHLSPRYGATAVWTGEQAIVWGGASSDGARLDDGATYRP